MHPRRVVRKVCCYAIHPRSYDEYERVTHSGSRDSLAAVMTTQLVRSTDSLDHVHTTFYHVTITSMRLHEITKIDTSRMTKAQKKAHVTIMYVCIYVYMYL